MSIETLLQEMNDQNAVHMDARNGNRTESILRIEKEINRLGFQVGFKYGTFYIIKENN